LQNASFYIRRNGAESVKFLHQRNSRRGKIVQIGMSLESPHEITALLQAWSNGDQEALESLTPLVDQELRRIARLFLDRPRSDPVF